MGITTKKIIKNTIIYFMLILGFVYLYVVDIDAILNPGIEQEVKSKIDFVYQQF